MPAAAAGAYVRPRTLAEALARLAETPPWTVLAGATVYYLNPANDPARDRILDVTRLPELTAIDAAADHIGIGAAVTWAALAAAGLPASCRALADAARVVGSVQIQNAGTIGGNLCAAAATADGIPPLLALGAEVELASLAGRRTLPAADFLLGARRTARRPDELLVGIRLPLPAGAAASRYLKLAQRAYQAPAVVSVAGQIGCDDGRIAAAAFVVGACSSLAKRLPALERRLIGRRVDAGRLADWVDADEDLALLCPTDDVRVSARYRLAAALELVRRLLAGLQADLR